MAWLREGRPDLPAILTSGYMGDEGPRPQGHRAPVFLLKLFSAQQLLARAAPLLAAPVSGADGE